jgi:hypothetical protein
MAQYQITLDSKTLHQLFLGNSQDAGVAQLLESVLNLRFVNLVIWGKLLLY